MYGNLYSNNICVSNKKTEINTLYSQNIALKRTLRRRYHCWFVFQRSGLPDLAPKAASLTEDTCGFPQSLRENAGMLLSSTVNSLDIDIMGCIPYLSVNI